MDTTPVTIHMRAMLTRSSVRAICQRQLSGVLFAESDADIFLENAMTSWKKVLRSALVSGSSASVLSTAALMAGGQRDCGSVFAPVNAVSHWLWKDKAIRQDKPSPRYTLTGYGIHHAMAILWAITYEACVSRYRRPAREGVSDSTRSQPKHAAGPAWQRRADDAPESRVRRPADDQETGEGRRERAGDETDESRAVPLPLRPVLITAAAVAAGACLVDLRCTPQRLTPGFERRLSPSSLFVVYAAFGIGLALCDGLAT